MPLKSTGEPGLLDFAAVTFIMLKDEQRIRCCAEADALENIEKSVAPTNLERLGIFEPNRRTFEILASRLWDAGYPPRVRSGDLRRL